MCLLTPKVFVICCLKIHVFSYIVGSFIFLCSYNSQNLLHDIRYKVENLGVSGRCVLSEEVVEDVPCAVLELSVLFCCTEEVKLQLYSEYSFLQFPSKISASFCVSFIYKPVSLS